MLWMEGWTDGRTGGRRGGDETGGGRKRGLRACIAARSPGNIYFPVSVCSHLSAAGRRPTRAGTGRDA